MPFSLCTNYAPLPPPRNPDLGTVSPCPKHHPIHHMRLATRCNKEGDTKFAALMPHGTSTTPLPRNSGHAWSIVADVNSFPPTLTRSGQAGLEIRCYKSTSHPHTAGARSSQELADALLRPPQQPGGKDLTSPTVELYYALCMANQPQQHASKAGIAAYGAVKTQAPTSRASRTCTSEPRPAQATMNETRSLGAVGNRWLGMPSCSLLFVHCCSRQPT